MIANEIETGKGTRIGTGIEIEIPDGADASGQRLFRRGGTAMETGIGIATGTVIELAGIAATEVEALDPAEAGSSGLSKLDDVLLATASYWRLERLRF